MRDMEVSSRSTYSLLIPVLRIFGLRRVNNGLAYGTKLRDEPFPYD